MAAKGTPPKIETTAASRSDTSALPAELIHFDKLPNSAHVRLPVVEGLYACCTTSVWRGVRAGRIPAPTKLGPNITAWNVGKLRAALERAS